MTKGMAFEESVRKMEISQADWKLLGAQLKYRFNDFSV